MRALPTLLCFTLLMAMAFSEGEITKCGKDHVGECSKEGCADPKNQPGLTFRSPVCGLNKWCCIYT